MLTLEIKLNRLFALGHERGQDERTTDDVARAVSVRLGWVLDPSILVEARAGQRLTLPAEVADAICDEFGVEEHLYLREDDSAVVTRIDYFIQLWILVRDRDLRHLAARGNNLDLETVKEIIHLLEQTAPADAAPAEVSTLAAGA
ncbi:hypothetical protein [Nocardia sp. CA-119907]|uniref:hypothetical protein n=1 Tax=Nocardia sp. CA-119907 TaxID=3239973 RepID=UPI003D95BA3A